MGNCTGKPNDGGYLFNRKSYIKNLKSSNVDKDFSFEGLHRTAKVCSIYDGDTCRVAFYLNEPPEKNEEPIRISVRLDKIDTPEMKPKKPASKESAEREKQLAIKAKMHLAFLLDQELVHVCFGKNGKFGRPLATIYQQCNRKKDFYSFEMSVNQSMITSGHAKWYDGGKKESW